MQSTQETALQAQQRVTRESVLDAIEAAAKAKAEEDRAYAHYSRLIEANPELLEAQQQWRDASHAEWKARKLAESLQQKLSEVAA